MESGATVFEIKEMARKINNATLDEIAMKDQFGRRVFDANPFRDAILVEALTCLAVKKEAERAAKQTSSP